ncbi:YcxB family protein [Altericroceibacterium spongiae]|nr:YcxB family protein [Altericroceibacterium spongiae]
MKAPTSPNIHYALSENDIIAAQRAWWMGAARWQSFIKFVAILWGVYAVMLVGLDLYAGEQPNMMVLLGVLPVSAVIVVILFAFGFLQSKRRARRAYREHKALTGEHIVSWNDEGILFTSPIGSSTLPWSGFYGWLDGPETLLLYQTHMMFNPLPKAILPPGAVSAIANRLRDAGVPERERFGFIRSDA